MSEPLDPLEALLSRELSRPVPTSAERKRRIMELVRASAPPTRRSWRRSWVSPVAGLALAAAASGVMALGAMRPAAAPARVVDAIQDTLRLVRFMFEAPAATSVALAGDFNQWSARATPLSAEGSAGVWSVVVALAPGEHRYAFVVNDTGWVADPRAAARTPARADATAHDRRAISVVTVPADDSAPAQGAPAAPAAGLTDSLES